MRLWASERLWVAVAPGPGSGRRFFPSSSPVTDSPTPALGAGSNHAPVGRPAGGAFSESRDPCLKAAV